MRTALVGPRTAECVISFGIASFTTGAWKTQKPERSRFHCGHNNNLRKKTRASGGREMQRERFPNGPRDKIFFGGALRRLKFIARFLRQNNGNDGERPPPHSSWTAAIQSGRRGARRNQSHQRTQGNVLWQRGGHGRLRGRVAAALLSPPQQFTV
jgi:hypothetical protein